MGISWLFADSPTDVVVDEVRDELVVYGDAPSAFGRLWVPKADGDDPAPVVVVIHGGFWQRRVADLSIMSPIVEALFTEGYAVWNVEYGRVGEGEGGWPHTFVHVGDAVDHVEQLASAYAIDGSRVAVLGHSAGGQLAVWAGGRRELLAGDPGADPVVEPDLVVALAPVLNLEIADEEGLANNAVARFLDGHVDEVPDRYRVAGVGRNSANLRVVVGTDDDIVPERFAIDHADAAVIRLDALGHFGLIDPGSAVMPVLLDVLDVWRRT